MFFAEDETTVKSESETLFTVGIFTNLSALSLHNSLHYVLALFCPLASRVSNYRPSKNGLRLLLKTKNKW
jgi:hypothetical protein